MRASDRAGVRAVAMFEGLKGLLVLLTGFGLLALVHRDLQSAAEALVRHLHLNPASHLPTIFTQLAARLSDARLWAFALAAFAYSTLRFAEAYGLWNDRVWASWLAVVSGGLYLPVEAYEAWHETTRLHLAVFACNVLLVVYLARRLAAHRGR